ncbi:MAG: dihydroorotase [Bacteroidales bacterium]|nr:dihydroorotase [Bacteroidales bacterium]
MKKILLANATIVNQNKEFLGSVLISGNTIEEVFVGAIPHSMNLDSIEYIDCSGKYIFPGIIDDQVHFREPGLTHKGTIKSESKAAVAGGITSYMEMPNVIPQTTTIQNLEEKFALAARDSYANYSFYIGATNSNIDQLKAIDKRITCGVKVFMGSSTGNMLVDNDEALTAIFKNVKIPIATHCEDETTIRKNLEHYTHIYGDAIPIQFHPLIRSREACMKSSSFAVQLAKKHNARLHILHVSTADELQLFESGPVSNKQITAEVCVHHLWFSADDYHTKGASIKWNPAIKNKEDRDALQQAVCANIIDVVATDHAPHLYNEKTGNYTSAASGGPLVQHSLLAMLDLHTQNIFSLSEIVTKMCHAPAELFTIYNRGYIAKGMFADIVVVDLHKKTHVTPNSLLYTCGWSPFNGHTFSSTIDKTFVNGQLVYANGQIHDVQAATHLIFSR